MSTQITIVGTIRGERLLQLYSGQHALSRAMAQDTPSEDGEKPATSRTVHFPVTLTFSETKQPDRWTRMLFGFRGYLEAALPLAMKIIAPGNKLLLMASDILARTKTVSSDAVSTAANASQLAKDDDELSKAIARAYEEVRNAHADVDLGSLSDDDVREFVAKLRELSAPDTATASTQAGTSTDAEPAQPTSLPFGARQITQLNGWLPVDLAEHGRRTDLRFTLRGTTRNDIRDGESRFSNDARFDIFGPDGSHLFTHRIDARNLEQLWLKEGAQPVVTVDSTSTFERSLPGYLDHASTDQESRIVKGRIWFNDGSSTGVRRVAVFVPARLSQRLNGDCAQDIIEPSDNCCHDEESPVILAPMALAVAETDEAGYFEFVYRCSPHAGLASRHALLRISGISTSIAVDLTRARGSAGHIIPSTMLLEVDKALAKDEPSDTDTVRWEDDAAHECSGCKDKRFDEPNRALDEFSFNFIIRTTEPQGNVRRFAHSVDKTSRKQASKTVVESLQVDDLFRTNLSRENPIHWDDTTDLFEVTSIAHGRVLTMKQVWRADGYSLGDLLYSLPLAPLQKKNLAIYEWDRSSSSSRAESQYQNEALTNDVRHDRDIAEIVNSAMSETIRARSESGSQSGSRSGGLLGGIFGGGSSGSASAWSTSSQDSMRQMSGRFLSALRDRTMQAATAYRSHNVTVVEQRSDSETSRVATETVANRNACHAVTIQYFEVLRHFRVDYELTGVRECLFVPLAMGIFDERKVLRWKSAIKGYAMNSEVPAWVDACERLKTNHQYPANTNGDESVLDLHGEIQLTLEFPTPAAIVADEKYDGSDPSEYAVKGYPAWLPGRWSVFSGMPRDSREAYFRRTFAPLLARRLIEDLRIQLIDETGHAIDSGLTFTMTDRYLPGGMHRISVRRSGAIPNGLTRARIRQVRITTQSLPMPVSAVSIVNRVHLEYSTERFDGTLLDNVRVDDSLRKVNLAGGAPDDVHIWTRMNQFEKTHPRQADEESCDKLLSHLNEFLEYYHKAIWWTMDPDRRYAILDGFIAPNAGGRSVAAVVENQLLGIVGNCIVMPVAPGIRLDYFDEIAALQDDLRRKSDTREVGQGREDTDTDPLLVHYRPFIPNPSARVSIPTRGVFAESVMGRCNSCEHIDETRNWRYWEHELPDQPAEVVPIGIRNPEPAAADSKPGAMPAPIIAQVQTSPQALPSASVLSSALATLAQPNAFRSETGLAGTQENAREALRQSFESTNKFGELAAGLVQQAAEAVAAYYTGGASELKKVIGKDAAAGRITKEQAQKSIGRINDVVADAVLPSPTRTILENPDISAVMSAAAERGAPVTVAKGDTRVDVGAPTLPTPSSTARQPNTRWPWPLRLFMGSAQAAQTSPTPSLDFNSLWNARDSVNKREVADYFSPQAIVQLGISSLCAVKLSDALSRFIPLDTAYQISSAYGKDGRRYVLSAERFAEWLEANKSSIGTLRKHRRPALSAFFKELRSSGARGIIFLKDYYRTTRDGDHIDLWNGERHSSDLWDSSTDKGRNEFAYLARLERDCHEIWFWEIDRK